jgi:hypothetical protein
MKAIRILRHSRKLNGLWLGVRLKVTQTAGQVVRGERVSSWSPDVLDSEGIVVASGRGYDTIKGVLWTKEIEKWGESKRRFVLLIWPHVMDGETGVWQWPVHENGVSAKGCVTSLRDGRTFLVEESEQVYIIVSVSLGSTLP